MIYVPHIYPYRPLHLGWDAFLNAVPFKEALFQPLDIGGVQKHTKGTICFL